MRKKHTFFSSQNTFVRCICLDKVSVQYNYIIVYTTLTDGGLTEHFPTGIILSREKHPAFSK